MKTSVLILTFLILDQVAAQSNLDSIIYSDPVIEEQLNRLAEDQCYMQIGYVMPILPDLRSMRCDSLRKLLVSELYGMFTPEQLFELSKESGNYHVELFSFQAFTQSSYDSDSLIAYFESEIARLAPHIFHPESYLISQKFGIVSPYYEHYYPNSNQLGLEDYVYLQTEFNNAYGYTWANDKSFTFNVTRDHLDFGSINLKYFEEQSDTFELRGNIYVQNISNEIIVIAPYYGSNIQFEKLSYRIPAKSIAEIPFRCNVSISEHEGQFKRTIKLENYKTKKYKFFTFSANFIAAPN